jgi:hypothetical protein
MMTLVLVLGDRSADILPIVSASCGDEQLQLLQLPLILTSSEYISVFTAGVFEKIKKGTI